MAKRNRDIEKSGDSEGRESQRARESELEGEQANLPGGMHSDYEQERAANINWQNQLLEELGIRQTLRETEHIDKEIKTIRRHERKKNRDKVIEKLGQRTSLRSQGLDPEGKPIVKKINIDAAPIPKKSYQDVMPETQHFKDALDDYLGGLIGSYWVKFPVSVEVPSWMNGYDDESLDVVKRDEGIETYEKYLINDESVRKIVPGGGTCLSLMPHTNSVVAYCGGSEGHVGIWRLGESESQYDGCAALFKVNSAKTKDIKHIPHSNGQFITRCASGAVRLCDTEKQVFSKLKVISSDAIDVNSRGICLYGAKNGALGMLDVRAGKKTYLGTPSNPTSKSGRFNTTLFSPLNENSIFTTRDNGLLNLWDIRYPISTLPVDQADVNRSVIGSFSPSGNRIAVTANCKNDSIFVYNGDSLKDQTKISHGSFTSRWQARFMAEFDPRDEKYIVIGGQQRNVDIFSVLKGKTGGRWSLSLKDWHMTAIPVRNSFHGTRNIIVSMTGSGYCYVWRN